MILARIPANPATIFITSFVAGAKNALVQSNVPDFANIGARPGADAQANRAR
jgi:hypothetical protein